MINQNNLIILDLETGDRDPQKCPLIQIAALAVEPRSLQIYPDGEFSAYCCPTNFDDIKDAMTMNLAFDHKEILHHADIYKS